MLDRAEIDALFPADLPGPEHWEQRYPPRELAPGAMVTRVGPSPTGFAHLGAVYVAMLNKDLAVQSGGDYFIRIEDTDQLRTVEGATAQFDAAFGYFGVNSEETDDTGAYGPYTQSARARIYLTYVREFLREGKAYLCFAAKEELAAATEEQRAEKVPSGYYGRWATWRDAPEELVRERLAAGQPYVVRFRSPDEAGRVAYTDLVRGRLEADANRNDIVILKSSDSPQGPAASARRACPRKPPARRRGDRPRTAQAAHLAGPRRRQPYRQRDRHHRNRPDRPQGTGRHPPRPAGSGTLCPGRPILACRARLDRTPRRLEPSWRAARRSAQSVGCP